MGQVILATRILRFETWARDYYEAHFKENVTWMYQKCKGLDADGFDLQGAIVKDLSAQEEAS